MKNFDIYIQKTLIYSTLDDFTPNGALAEYLGGQFGDNFEEWSEAVIEFITTLWRLELICVIPGLDFYKALNSEQIEFLLRNGDKVRNFSAHAMWDIICFYGTPKLREIINSCGLYGWDALEADLCPRLGKLIDELEGSHSP